MDSVDSGRDVREADSGQVRRSRRHQSELYGEPGTLRYSGLSPVASPDTLCIREGGESSGGAEVHVLDSRERLG